MVNASCTLATFVIQTWNARAAEQIKQAAR